jgi:hypothetical protein
MPRALSGHLRAFKSERGRHDREQPDHAARVQERLAGGAAGESRAIRSDASPLNGCQTEPTSTPVSKQNDIRVGAKNEISKHLRGRVPFEDFSAAFAVKPYPQAAKVNA